MKAAPKPKNELQRLSALYEYQILDTAREPEYDDITRIASEICGTPISLITLIDSNRQWFKSTAGINLIEAPLEPGFCTHAILQPDDIFIIDNPKEDERFFDNPSVTGPPHVAFYAGVSLVNDTGKPLGTLCVIDNKPRELTGLQKDTLKALARLVVANLEIRKRNKQMEEQKAEMEALNVDLSKFANQVALDVRSPFSSLTMSSKLLIDHYSDVLDSAAIEFLTLMEETASDAIDKVNGILKHTQTVHGTDISKELFTFGDLADEIRKQLKIPAAFSIIVNNPGMELYTSRSILLKILLTLCGNAIKYNDKKEGMLTISAGEIGHHYLFTVRDNGQGIKSEDREAIFNLFYVPGNRNKFKNKGTGIGLSIVKRLVEKMNGTIKLVSEPGVGSTFEFTIKK